MCCGCVLFSVPGGPREGGFFTSHLQIWAANRHATPGSLTAHALEPVLEVVNSIVKTADGL